MEDNGPLRHLDAFVNWFANKKLFLENASSVIHFLTLMDTNKLSLYLFPLRILFLMQNEREKGRRKEKSLWNGLNRKIYILIIRSFSKINLIQYSKIFAYKYFVYNDSI